MLSLLFTKWISFIRTWLVHSNDGLPQNALGLHEQASWMHTHLVSFVEVSYTYISSAFVAWQSILTHIDIYWWASPSPVDMPSWCETIFSLFVLTTTTIYHHSAMSMTCAHVLRKSWKSWGTLKSMKWLLGLSSELCMMGVFCVMKMKHGLTIWFCRDKLSLAMLFW